MSSNEFKSKYLGQIDGKYWRVQYVEGSRKRTKYFGFDRLAALRFLLGLFEKYAEQNMKSIAEVKAEIEAEEKRQAENGRSPAKKKASRASNGDGVQVAEAAG